jgi:DnaJ-domain-containing protein 1
MHSSDDDEDDAPKQESDLQKALNSAKFYKEMYESEKKKSEMLAQLNGAHEALIREWIKNA